MPDIKLGGNLSQTESTPTEENDSHIFQEEALPVEEELKTETDDNLIEEDPNKIVVTISDNKTPLVVLFGPPACGKTMSLIRLARYLRSKNYVIQPDESFRPSSDPQYKAICKNFDSMIDNPDAANSTSRISFMLASVLYKGNTLCKILEAPGEHYFDYKHPEAEFPRYVQTIINQPNRKIWLIMVEPVNTNIIEYNSRIQYARKISKLKKRLLPRDKVIFVFNKIDTTEFVSGTSINYRATREETKNQYPNIFTPFENMNPITKWWRPFNCDFVAFQTGNYTETFDGTLTFTPSSDIYPKRLWELILKRIRG